MRLSSAWTDFTCYVSHYSSSRSSSSSSIMYTYHITLIRCTHAINYMSCLQLHVLFEEVLIEGTHSIILVHKRAVYTGMHVIDHQISIR